VTTTEVFGGAVAQSGWREFLASWQHLTPDDLSAADTTTGVSVTLGLYRSSRGRLVVPHDSPFVPVTIEHGDTVGARRLERRWLSLTERIGQELLHERVARPWNLPPGIVDVRGFQQAGFRLESRFTSVVDLPWQETSAVKKVRQRARRAVTEGFTAARGTDPGEVLRCLTETEERKHFRYRIDEATLRLGVEILGSDRFRFYLARASSGEVASARVVICSDDGDALGWVSGTRTRFLASGVQQLMTRATLEDLSNDGFATFDWAGVNIPSIASAKEDWGGRLTPFTAAFPRNGWDIAQGAWHAMGYGRHKIRKAAL
jgi:hypothetical protein